VTILAVCVLASCSHTEEISNLTQKTLDDLVFVEGGTFTMGDVGYTAEDGQHYSFGTDADAYPLHQVTLTSYSILKYEITFSQYDLFAMITGRGKPLERYRGKVYTGENYPVDGVSWEESRAYCNWIGDQIGYPMDLPTEAQWEYAARSKGKNVGYATDNGEFEPGRNIRDPKQVWHPMPVGSWPPNPLGIYDMTGNVDEWTVDYWRAYRPGAVTDPRNDQYDKYKSEERVTRGAGVIGGRRQIAVYVRAVRNPDNTGAGIGIRCVVNYPEPITQPGSKK